MTEKTVTDPDDTTDEWTDVRMTDPEEGEWDVDVVVVDGRVNYVDLRIRPDHLAAFVDRLFADINDDSAGKILREMAARKDIDLHPETSD